MTRKLKDYKKDEMFDGYLLIKNAERGTASNGHAFISLTLADTSGEISSKLWNATADDIRAYTNGTIIRCDGTIGEYRDKPQLNMNRIRKADDTDSVSVEDLLPSAPLPRHEMEDTIRMHIYGMRDYTCREVTLEFVNRYNEDLFTFPAATNIHHAYAGGLAHHITGMLALANSICDLHPTLNRDLLTAGVILHDIGKIYEYESVTNPTFTTRGQLIGHINILTSILHEVADAIGGTDDETVMLLEHLILSHHGKPEWGSAKRPVIREAEVLHYIDLMDAKLNTLGKALAETETGAFTERLFALDNRRFYRHPLTPNV